MIGVLDYGAGNLHSVLKAFVFLGLPACIVEHPAQLRRVQRLVVPGVGAFGAAMHKLETRGMREAIIEWVAGGRPLLGICLGMQLLLEASAESPGAQGLGIIAGENRRFAAGKVPQIGWNRVRPTAREALFARLPPDPWMYFVHSYHACPVDGGAVIATACYEVLFPAALRCGSAVGVQFHPEKSGAAGLTMLRNWAQA